VDEDEDGGWKIEDGAEALEASSILYGASSFFSEPRRIQ
jgi:hypothetical protein